MKKEKQPIWLNLGSGVNLANPPFISVDNFFTLEDLKEGVRTKEGQFKNAKIPKGSKFVKADICKLPFEDNYADYIECNDVIEHQPMNMVGIALKEMYRVLKPGAKLGLSTTNFDELAKLWTINVTGNPLNTKEDWDKYLTLAQVIYGNQAGEGEFHKTPFNPYSLGYLLQDCGFKLENITITIYPTNSPYLAPQKAYESVDSKDLSNAIMLTEMMWVEAIK